MTNARLIRRPWRVVVCASVFAVLASCTPTAPPTVPPTDPPPPPGSPLEPTHLDCARWRYDGVEPGPLPEEWDAKDYRFTSERDGGSARSPHRQCGQLGSAVDLAWSLEQGLPETVIAVLDSGIKWRDPGAAEDLAATAYLNRGELPVPIAGEDQVASPSDPYDVNGDGRFSVEDYRNDPRVSDRNENEVLDPEDLILTPEFNDGVDSDGNGYIDDISGWDFLFNDNNPLDDVSYGHGTGEAKDSAAAHNGMGAFGVCGQCSHLPVRVSDSFMAAGARFAAGVLFAIDSGASVIQEALGAITNPPQVQQAVDAAYASDIPVVASMADEQSEHANLPSAINHAMAVNSVTEAMSFLDSVGPILTGRRDTLALNGCTNFGAIAWVSVPSVGCSSEATGNGAGMVGLVVSAAKRAGIKLTANEVMQVIRATADDIDFSTPNAIDPANDMTDDFGQRRFPSVRGWDATHGFGRLNAYEAVKSVVEKDIPPEADITSPRWFSMEPTSGTLPVIGTVAAPRSGSYSYRVEWTTGLQTPPYPATDTWHVVQDRSGLTAPVDGQLAQIDLADVAAALPGKGTGEPVDASGKPEPDRFTVRVRVVVTDADGRVGIMNRQFSVHDDPTLSYSTVVDGAGMSSPRLVDVDGDGHDEMVLGTDEGYVHVFDSTGKVLPGFPVRTPEAFFWHSDSPAAQAFGITAPGAAIPVGAPAVGDLDGDGTTEIVVTDLGGNVTWWNAQGERVGHVSVNPDFSRQEATNEWNRLKPGIAGSAALGDLDGDGTLEIVVAAMDRHVYAWHADSSPVDGFPVLVVDPNMVSSIDPDTHQVTFRSPEGTGIGGELIATPALGDLNGDGRPEIVVGAQEQYDEQVAVFPAVGLPSLSGNTRVYAISPDGTNASGRYSRGPSSVHPDAQAYLPGWPVPLPMLMTDVLPTIGGGVSTQAAIGDVNGDGRPEVVVSSVSGQVMVLNSSGRSAYGLFDLMIAPGWLG
ncbi:MAG: FG-GAP repeat protein, partial [Microthrixaceae bacterium]|nr:FG-GAP repeat protein [Microthrixaceae bacterium]